MTGMVPVGLVASSTLAQLCAGWLAVLPVAALAIYGWYRGAFLATIAGLQVLSAFLAAVMLAVPVAGVVESLGCPAAQALAAAYVLVFAAGIVAVRMAVGAVVPDEAFRLGAVVDQVGGGLLGAAAGMLLGGALLVGWSMADMPAWIRLDNTHQPLDSGGRALGTFARFAASEPGGWKLLLDGDGPAPDPNAAGVVRASEPFADSNGNGVWDAAPSGPGNPAGAGGEPYLDADGDGLFTTDSPWLDADADGRRDVGLRDCYRLADWRRTRVMHPPRIESADAAEVLENTPVEEAVYTARASDADGDAITFTVEAAAAGEDPGVVIDPASGVVTLAEAADFERAKGHDFVVVATDATGMVARKTVRVRVRDELVEPAPP